MLITFEVYFCAHKKNLSLCKVLYMFFLERKGGEGVGQIVAKYTPVHERA